MSIIWIVIAVCGVLAGLVISRAAPTPSQLASTNGRRDVAAMVSVWAVLLLVFLLVPLVRVPLGAYFPQVGSLRLFGVYGYSSVFAVCFFGTCFIATLAKRFRLLFGGAPRNGA